MQHHEFTVHNLLGLVKYGFGALQDQTETGGIVSHEGAHHLQRFSFDKMIDLNRERYITSEEAGIRFFEQNIEVHSETFRALNSSIQDLMQQRYSSKDAFDVSWDRLLSYPDTLVRRKNGRLFSNGLKSLSL